MQDSSCVNLNLTNTVCGTLQLGRIKCESLLRIEGTGSEKFSKTVPTDPFSIDSVYIRNNLDLWNITAPTGLEIDRITVAGRVWLYLASIGRMTLKGLASAPLRMGALLIEHCTINGDLRFRQAIVGTRAQREFDGIASISDTTLHGNLELFEPRQIRQNTADPDERQANGWMNPNACNRILRKLLIQRCIIAGNLDLTRIIVGRADPTAFPPDYLDGEINLGQSTIRGNVYFRSPESVIADSNLVVKT